MIVKGSSSVLVNGLPAARIGDGTNHGGVIVTGCPSVLIGDAGGAGSGMQPVTQNAKVSSTGKTSPKGGSTIVIVDDVKQTVIIRTNMEFFGSGASEAYAQAAKKQIEETWTGTMTRNGKIYSVKTEVTAKYNASSTPTKGYDQILVDSKNTRMNQTLYGAGPGNQTPSAATDKDRPRRIAHEYGHTLGLQDGYEDTVDGSKPKNPNKKNDIMSETWPDSKGTLPRPHQDDYEQVLKNYGYD